MISSHHNDNQLPEGDGPQLSLSEEGTVNDSTSKNPWRKRGATKVRLR